MHFTTYQLCFIKIVSSILVDIQQILSSKDPLEISDGKIDCQLDEFVLQFQVWFNLLCLEVFV